MDKLIDMMDEIYESIYNDRVKIEELIKAKTELKPKLWEEATGTVDQKKDYIRSRVSDYDMKIHNLESLIEYKYNKIRVLDYKLVYCNE